MDLDELYRRATGFAPYPHQRQAAEMGLPEVLRAPTGSGKTETAVLGWLWRRRYHPDVEIRSGTPHWLVYALPTRGLVEQVRDRVRAMVDGLGLAAEVPVHRVLGGESWNDRSWRIAPTSDAVFVGTVDMLLSRALNRGFADSRWNWPISFGLFNSGVHWVLDEVQLMEVATLTTRQLDAFRTAMGTALPTRSTWMSATLDDNLLITVDRPSVGLVLDATSLQPVPEALRLRFEADKTIHRLGVEGRYEAKIADHVLCRHRPGHLTLVVVNTVARSQEIYRRLRTAVPDEVELRLVHRRFRPTERRAATDAIVAPLPAGGRIVVATQVLEAGVDLDAAVMVTEAAPWDSLVQRAGRCNRSGSVDAAELWWVEPPNPAPYDADEVADAIGTLTRIEGSAVSPLSISSLGPPKRPRVQPVLRRRDLVDLFDTSPDLTGNDLDVSRFIRDGQERDVMVAWREVSATARADADLGPRPGREELCPAPLGEVREFVRKPRGGATAWRLDHLGNPDGRSSRERRWMRCLVEDVRPGLIVVFSADAGGYHVELGWKPNSTDDVSPAVTGPAEGPGGDDVAVGDDPASTIGAWIGLESHLRDVEREVAFLLDDLEPDLGDDVRRAAARAGALHDVGKAHRVWQDAAARMGEPDTPPPWAKTGSRRPLRFDRRHFRHELASLVALLGDGAVLVDLEPEADLVRYLVASHHGRVRVGARRLPDEGHDVVLGLTDGSTLPPVATPAGLMPDQVLGLDELGLGPALEAGPERSWTARVLALRDRDDMGPFRLAFLEAVVRLADWRASSNEEGAVGR